jgi:hypothetical protein
MPCSTRICTAADWHQQCSGQGVKVACLPTYHCMRFIMTTTYRVPVSSDNGVLAIPGTEGPRGDNICRRSGQAKATISKWSPSIMRTSRSSASAVSGVLSEAVAAYATACTPILFTEAVTRLPIAGCRQPRPPDSMLDTTQATPVLYTSQLLTVLHQQPPLI